jgi:hypothetical protein
MVACYNCHRGLCLTHRGKLVEVSGVYLNLCPECWEKPGMVKPTMFDLEVMKLSHTVIPTHPWAKEIDDWLTQLHKHLHRELVTLYIERTEHCKQFDPDKWVEDRQVIEDFIEEYGGNREWAVYLTELPLTPRDDPDKPEPRPWSSKE